MLSATSVLKSLDPRALVDRAVCAGLVKKSTFIESEHDSKPRDRRLTCYSVGREHSQVAQFAVILTSHQDPQREAFLTNYWQLKRQKVNWRHEIKLVTEAAYLTLPSTAYPDQLPVTYHVNIRTDLYATRRSSTLLTRAQAVSYPDTVHPFASCRRLFDSDEIIFSHLRLGLPSELFSSTLVKLQLKNHSRKFWCKSILTHTHTLYITLLLTIVYIINIILHCTKSLSRLQEWWEHWSVSLRMFIYIRKI